jgi:hypothetical protein
MAWGQGPSRIEPDVPQTSECRFTPRCPLLSLKVWRDRLSCSTESVLLPEVRHRLPGMPGPLFLGCNTASSFVRPRYPNARVQTGGRPQLWYRLARLQPGLNFAPPISNGAVAPPSNRHWADARLLQPPACRGACRVQCLSQSLEAHQTMGLQVRGFTDGRWGLFHGSPHDGAGWLPAREIVAARVGVVWGQVIVRRLQIRDLRRYAEEYFRGSSVFVPGI